jgi:hypothetical protein
MEGSSMILRKGYRAPGKRKMYISVHKSLKIFVAVVNDRPDTIPTRNGSR